MSIKAMSNTWDHSEQKGSKLLLLLAIADHSDEYGYAWPGIALLADKTRMSERHTMRLLGELEEARELYIDRREYNNRYIVTVGMDAGMLAEVLALRLGYDPNTAAEIAEAFFSSDEKNTKDGDILSPSEHGDIPAQHGDIPAQHGDIPAQHGDIPAQHGDTDVTLTIITPNKPSRESSESPGARAREREGTKQPDIDLDPKIAAFMSVWETEVGGTINAMMREEIGALVEMCNGDVTQWRSALQLARKKSKYGNPMAYARAVIENQAKNPGGQQHERHKRSGDGFAGGEMASVQGADSYQPPDLGEWFRRS